MHNQHNPAATQPQTRPRQFKQRLLKLVLFCGFLILFIFLLARLDSRTADNHKPWHTDFTIAAFEPNGSFLALPYSYVQQHSLANITFLAKNPNGSKQKNDSDAFSYKVVQQTAQQQLIQTSLRTSHSITVATYQATASTVTPIKSTAYAVDQISMAAVLALISVLSLQFLYRFLRRRHSHQKTN
jgi:flagellar biogenesis protein FliO